MYLYIKFGGECVVLTLDEVKLYLRIDGDEENGLITNFMLTAEEICADILRFPLSDFTEIPDTVKQSILYIVANLYEKREELDIKETFNTISRLLFAYRKESW
jgi:uncharacterized phage protein (predicted DNA packaging)